MKKLLPSEITNIQRLQLKLREQQRELVLAAAANSATPHQRLIQKIAELESAIVAVDAVLQDGQP